MSEAHWPSVIVVGLMNVVFVAILIVAKLVVVKRAVRAEMTVAVEAMKRRLDASEIFLTAAEQHTAHQEEWEKRRQEDHERRQKEYTSTLQKIVAHEIGKQLKQSEKVVVNEVQQVPDKVMEKANADPDSGLRKKLPGTGDSHHG